MCAPLSLSGSRSRGGARSRGGPRSLRACPGVGERELAEETGLARSAYISSESALRTELLLEEADDTDETLLTDRDLQHQHSTQDDDACLLSHPPEISY